MTQILTKRGHNRNAQEKCREIPENVLARLGLRVTLLTR